MRYQRGLSLIAAICLLSFICMPATANARLIPDTRATAYSQRSLEKNQNRQSQSWEPQSDDEDTSSWRKKHGESNLLDVWLCISVAFAWTVVMVSSLVPNDLERYSKDAFVILGHVLGVEANVYKYGYDADNIPSNIVTVDYMMECSESQSKIQVRKTFRTDMNLQQGFANVELLVIPEDPMSGLLKQQWEKEYADYRAMQQGTPGESLFSSLPFMFWMGTVVVFLCIVGVAVKVHLLPYALQDWGWISMVVGVTLLWPAASVAYGIGKTCRKLSTTSVEKGVIINPPQYSPEYYFCDIFKTYPAIELTDVHSTPASGNKSQQVLETMVSDLDNTALSSVSVQDSSYYINMEAKGRVSSTISNVSNLSGSVSASANTSLHHSRSATPTFFKLPDLPTFN